MKVDKIYIVDYNKETKCLMFYLSVDDRIFTDITHVVSLGASYYRPTSSNEAIRLLNLNKNKENSMRVKEMYFVHYINRVEQMFLLENGTYFILIYRDKGKPMMEVPTEKEALKLIEETKSGMHGTVLKEKA